MATIKFERIVSYSSEDPKYPADNLLKFGSKWKCKSPGEANATVILQLDQPRVIETIDLGNEHSAFIHVLVGRAASDEYESLLPASSFMSPLEADQSTNTNRVRMFTKQDFLKPAANEKWDRIKVICSQPFNKRVQYGLSFIVIKHPEVKPEPVSFGRFKLKNEGDNGDSSPVSLGRFQLKKESDDDNDVNVGSIFARRKDLVDKDDASTTNGTLPKPNGGTSLRPALSPAQQKAVAKKVATKQKDDPPAKQKVDLPSKLNANAPPKQVSPPPKHKPGAPPATKPQVHTKAVTPSVKLPGKQNTVQTTKRTTPTDKTKWPASGDKKFTASSKKTKSQLKSKPFCKLLEGVTIAISGYVNPARSELRSKAIDLGAKYKQDWDSSCTHLICAFVNTPKFRQVRGQGKIVQKDWIEQCHAKRSRLPWRRFALDVNDFKHPESEEEIVEEIPQPSTSSSYVPPDDSDLEMDTSAGCQAESGSDTEDEIERIEAKKKANTSSYNPYLSDTEEEDDDNERPVTTHMPMPPLPN